MTAQLGPLPPGSVIGILGGGQLGRMLAMAAAELGFACHVFTPEADSPAAAVAATATVAEWSDAAALARFAEGVDLITYEFENVPVEAVRLLEAQRPVFPQSRALAVAQDRLEEKTLMEGLGLPVAPFVPVESPAELARGLARLGGPAILKTRRLGYDGKGQLRLGPDDDAERSWHALGGVPCVLEMMVPLEREVSVLIARGQDGRTAAFDIAENEHRDGILALTRVPARIDGALAAAALGMAGRIAEALGYVGLLAVEMFVTVADGERRLLVNEIAPRVHNSGHWTSDACQVSQFQQHIRAICGWPLGNPARHADVQMTNLLGADADAWLDLAAEPGASLHLYGKREARPGRKMGHVNRLRPRGG